MNHKFWATARRLILHMQFTGWQWNPSCSIEKPNIAGKSSKTIINYKFLHFQLTIINVFLKQCKYQRTSGPVNAHLTPGPGIYFKAFIHIYSPRAGADNSLGTNGDVNSKSLSFCPFVAGLKKNCFEVRFYIHFFHVSPYEPPHDKTNKMACTPSEDSDRPGHPPSLISFHCQHEESLVLSYPLTAQRRLWLDCADVQADQSSLGAHAILFVLSWGGSIIYIAPGWGRQSIGNKLLMTTDRPFLFAHMLQVSK